jgi:uncharacterized membrane protein YuzA (DUF378 family)
MKKTLTRLAPGSVARVTGLAYFVFGLAGALILIIVNLLTKPQPYHHGRGGSMAEGDIWFALALPVLYGVAGLIFGYLGALVYNLVAKYVGGIKVELGSVSDED